MKADVRPPLKLTNRGFFIYSCFALFEWIQNGKEGSSATKQECSIELTEDDLSEAQIKAVKKRVLNMLDIED